MATDPSPLVLATATHGRKRCTDITPISQTAAADRAAFGLEPQAVAELFQRCPFSVDLAADDVNHAFNEAARLAVSGAGGVVPSNAAYFTAAEDTHQHLPQLLHSLAAQGHSSFLLHPPHDNNSSAEDGEPSLTSWALQAKLGLEECVQHGTATRGWFVLPGASFTHLPECQLATDFRRAVQALRGFTTGVVVVQGSHQMGFDERHGCVRREGAFASPLIALHLSSVPSSKVDFASVNLTRAASFADLFEDATGAQKEGTQHACLDLARALFTNKRPTTGHASKLLLQACAGLSTKDITLLLLPHPCHATFARFQVIATASTMDRLAVGLTAQKSFGSSLFFLRESSLAKALSVHPQPRRNRPAQQQGVDWEATLRAVRTCFQAQGQQRLPKLEAAPQNAWSLMFSPPALETTSLQQLAAKLAKQGLTLRHADTQQVVSPVEQAAPLLEPGTVLVRATRGVSFHEVEMASALFGDFTHFVIQNPNTNGHAPIFGEVRFLHNESAALCHEQEMQLSSGVVQWKMATPVPVNHLPACLRERTRLARAMFGSRAALQRLGAPIVPSGEHAAPPQPPLPPAATVPAPADVPAHLIPNNDGDEEMRARGTKRLVAQNAENTPPQEQEAPLQPLEPAPPPLATATEDPQPKRTAVEPSVEVEAECGEASL